MFAQILTNHLLAPKYLLWMWQGFQVTLLLTALVALLSTLFGLVLASARSSRQRALWLPAAAYTSLFRNTPLLVQLLFWYFGLPSLFPDGLMEWLNTDHALSVAGLFSLRWPSFEMLAALCGMVCYSTAYLSEEIRSGMRGVPHSQSLAGAALGLTRLQVLRAIVLPQAVRIALPSLMGQYMNILKNTSLTMGIGLAELSYSSRQVESESFLAFQAFAVATFLYIAAIAVLESVAYYQLHVSARTLSGGRRR